MSDRNSPDTENGAIKDPAEWTTGDEPMTGAQDSYVHTSPGGPERKSRMR